MQAHQLSSAGKRTILAMLVGALIIWAFALWTFRSTIGSVPGEPELGFFAALGRNLSQGFGIGQIIPALLMLVLVVATPLVFWNLIVEYAADYTATEQGLQFHSFGIALDLPWTTMTTLRTAEEVERGSALMFDRDITQHIGNPLVRLLYRLNYGRSSLPIYATLDERAALLDEIATRSGVSAMPPVLLHQE